MKFDVEALVFEATLLGVGKTLGGRLSKALELVHDISRDVDHLADESIYIGKIARRSQVSSTS